MQPDKFQFTATAATAAAATAVANTLKLVADYLISNHCQNSKNHHISKNTAVIHNFQVATAATVVAIYAATAAPITVD
jgi:hypothetical protein